MNPQDNFVGYVKLFYKLSYSDFYIHSNKVKPDSEISATTPNSFFFPNKEKRMRRNKIVQQGIRIRT